MSKFINEEMKIELQQILANLVSPVKLFFFTQRNVCPACGQQQELLEDLAALSNKLELRVYDFILQGDQSTAVEGFFAAGDATDVAEKQISVAVGQGALAALTAHKYLVLEGLTTSRIGSKELWQ